jgi:hypothetical protein
MHEKVAPNGRGQLKRYSFPVESFLLGGEDSASGFRSGQVATRAAESPLLRFFLSHFPTSRASRKLPGSTGLRSRCADARFAIATPSSATVGVVSRLTMSIMTGLRFGAASVTVVARPLPSCRLFLSPTHTTACWRGVRHYGSTSWNTAPLSPQPPLSRTPTG